MSAETGLLPTCDARVETQGGAVYPYRSTQSKERVKKTKGGVGERHRKVGQSEMKEGK